MHERRYDEMSHLEQSTLYLSGLDELMSEVGAKVSLVSRYHSELALV